MHVSVCVIIDITMKNFILSTLQHKELLKEFKTSKLSSLVQTIKTKFNVFIWKLPLTFERTLFLSYWKTHDGSKSNMHFSHF